LNKQADSFTFQPRLDWEDGMSTPISIYQFLRESLPVVFLGKELDILSQGILRWRTIQNQRSARLIPEECFEKISQRKVLIIRDRFLAWLFSEKSPRDKGTYK
jgi:hypothetical protein